MIKYQKDTDNIVTLRLDMAGRTDNIINHEIGKAFIPVIEHLKKEKEKGKLRGIIITSDKKTFLTGGELDYLVKNKDAKQIFEYTEKTKKFIRDLELPGVPVVAAINGSALGIGFELPLACHYKILLDRDNIRVGLPEVTLGLMPGSGANIRLLWLMGLDKAFSIISKGKKYLPKEALEVGLVDELALDEKDMMNRARTWLLSNPEGRQPWDRAEYKIPEGRANNPVVAAKIAKITANLVKDYRYNYPAPQAIFNTLVEGAKVDFDTACRIESRNFTQLVLSQEASNMTKAFWYDFNAIKKNLSRPKGFGKFRPKKIGIIGAGLMGSGIAYVCALHGLEVVLKDISRPVAERGKSFSAQKLSELVRLGKIKGTEKQAILDLITTTESPKEFQDCDLVIEAVFENQSVKKKVIKEAEQYMDDYAFFASNTSLIPITTLGNAASKPENFVGLHFFSPVTDEPLVEIVGGENTSDETIARAYDFVKAIKKIPILVKDNPGFYAARVKNTYILEGVALLQEGYDPAVIERLGVQAGMPYGPLEMADRVSLQSVLMAERQAAEHFGSKYQVHPAVEAVHQMIETHNRPGLSTGAGFYHYEASEKVGFWSDLSEHFPISRKEVQSVELMDRMMMVQALDAVWCLNDNIIQSVAEGNIGSIYGWGFPSFKGGTLQYINDYGMGKFIAKAKAFQDRLGPRFMVPRRIKKMEQEGIELV